jgi:hypothetical protein
MWRRGVVCPDCDSGGFIRDGKCRVCYGTGINIHLDSAAPDCENCKGSGMCPTCGGSGVYQDSSSGDIQRLFGSNPE